VLTDERRELDLLGCLHETQDEIGSRSVASPAEPPAPMRAILPDLDRLRRLRTAHRRGVTDAEDSSALHGALCCASLSNMSRGAGWRALAIASSMAVFGLGLVLLLGSPFTASGPSSPTSTPWTTDLAQACGISSESAAALRASLATSAATSIACLRLGPASANPDPTGERP
jgi:hypothetical protein